MRHRGRREVIWSAWSCGVRRPPPQSSGGKWERTNDAGEGRESAAGQRSQSGRKGSGGGEE